MIRSDRPLPRIIAGIALIGAGAVMLTGAALSANAAETLPALTITVEAGASATVDIHASAGSADLETAEITAAPPVGTANASHGSITYAAPEDVPAAYITPGLAADPTPILASVEIPDPTPTPTTTPGPTTTPSPTGTPSETPAPTDDPTPPPTQTPQPTQTPTPEPTGSSEPPQQPTDTATPAAAAADLNIEPASYTTAIGAMTSAPAPSPTSTTTTPGSAPVAISYSVCRDASRTDCLEGQINVVILPRALHTATGTIASAETGQQISIPAAAILTQLAGADWASFTANAARGTVTIGADHALAYTAPARTGDDTIDYRLCPLGDASSCVTGVVTVHVTHAFTAPSMTVTASTSTDGSLSVPNPATTGDNTADHASIQVVAQPSGVRIAIEPGAFRVWPTSADFVGQIAFRYRACSQINTASCSIGAVTVNVNTGYGFADGDHTAQAGDATTFHLRDFLADPHAWQPNPATATVALINGSGITINATALSVDGSFTLTIPARHIGPVTLQLCATGTSGVPFCRSIQIRVTVAALLLNTRLTGTTTHTPIPTSAAAIAAPTQTSGFDATWFIVGGAVVFMFFGGATLRNKHS